MSPLLAYIRNLAGICEKLFAEGHPSLQKNSKSDGQHRRFSAHRSCCCVVAWPLILIQVFCVTPCFAEQGNQDRELPIGLSATITKDVYDINEPVLLAYALSNYTDTQLFITTPPKTSSLVRVTITDVNGIRVSSVSEKSLMPPSSHIMTIDGKRKYVDPVSMIDARDTIVGTIPDALERHRMCMSPGVYYLTVVFSRSTYGEDAVFTREGFPDMLWLNQAKSVRTRNIVKTDPITFEIRREASDAQEEVANPARPDAEPAGTVANSRFSWKTFVGGTSLGAILASALFLLARRHEST